MKVRRKPLVFEAVQWFRDGDHPAVYQSRMIDIHVRCPGDPPDKVYPEPARSEERLIRTLEGEVTVIPGDWIMTGIKGEHWPVKWDIFEKTYEIVATDDAIDVEFEVTCPTLS